MYAVSNLCQLVEPLVDVRVNENVTTYFHEEVNPTQTFVSALFGNRLDVNRIHRCCYKRERRKSQSGTTNDGS